MLVLDLWGKIIDVFCCTPDLIPGRMYTVFVTISTNFTDQLSGDEFSASSVSGAAMTGSSGGSSSTVAVAVAVVIVVLFVIGAVICVVVFLVWYVRWYRELNDTNLMHVYIVRVEMCVQCTCLSSKKECNYCVHVCDSWHFSYRFLRKANDGSKDRELMFVCTTCIWHYCMHAIYIHVIDLCVAVHIILTTITEYPYTTYTWMIMQKDPRNPRPLPNILTPPLLHNANGS